MTKSFGDVTRAHQKYIIEAASQGWQYEAQIHGSFIAESALTTSHHTKLERPPSAPSTTVNLQIESPNELLAELVALNCPVKTQQRLQAAANSSVLLCDSYIGQSRSQVFSDIAASPNLTFVIFGAGPVGLFAANLLARREGTGHSIFVVENRVQCAGIKKSYDRDWVTNLPMSLFEGALDDRVVQIFRRLGCDGYAGAKVNTLESLLLMSCKELGVRFYFGSENIMHKAAEKSGVTLLNAMGVQSLSDGLDVTNKLEVIGTVTTPDRPHLQPGHSTHGITHQDFVSNRGFELARLGNLLVPLSSGQRIDTAMMKITGVPCAVYEALLAHIRAMNADGAFYIWPGKLAAAINEVVILITLDAEAARCISGRVNSTTRASELATESSLAGVLQGRFLSLLSTLLEQGGGESVCHAPFRYRPYIANIWEQPQMVAGKELVPIGDALFTGHPEVGNGLGAHLRLVRSIVGNLSTLKNY